MLGRVGSEIKARRDQPNKRHEMKAKNADPDRPFELRIGGAIFHAGLSSETSVYADSACLATRWAWLLVANGVRPIFGHSCRSAFAQAYRLQRFSPLNVVREGTADLGDESPLILRNPQALRGEPRGAQIEVGAGHSGCSRTASRGLIVSLRTTWAAAARCSKN